MYFPPPADAVDHATDGFPLLPDQLEKENRQSGSGPLQFCVLHLSSLCSFFVAHQVTTTFQTAQTPLPSAIATLFPGLQAAHQP